MIILKYKLKLNSTFFCESALSGKRALEMIQKDVERREHNSKECKYDLIFMDCNMPELDGFETTLAIR
jgi:CheY-like chemotaxis protein